MQFSALELAVCNIALRTTEQIGQDGRPFQRQLTVDQLEDGVNINKKLKTCISGDNFTEGEIDFATTEKSLLLILLNRPWGLDFGEAVSSLKEKLK